MGEATIIARRFPDRLKADLARQKLTDSGIRCEITTTRTSKNGDPQEYGLLIDRAEADRAAELLGPEPMPDPDALRKGERALQVIFAVVALILIVLFALSMLRVR